MATPEARLWASVRRYPHISACARSHCVHCHASAARAASAIAAFSPTLLPPLCAALCALSTPVCALALSRPLCLAPLCPTFAFSCALAPRRSSLSRAPSARRSVSLALSRPDAVRFIAPPLPGVRFLSRSRALSARRLFSFVLSRPTTHRLLFHALSRPNAVRFIAPPLPGVRFLSRSRAPTQFALSRPLCPAFGFSRALAPRRSSLYRTPSARRSVSLALSRPDSVRVFSRPLPTTPATIAFSRTLAPLRPPFAFFLLHACVRAVVKQRYCAPIFCWCSCECYC
jgi:hypothetical protein